MCWAVKLYIQVCVCMDTGDRVQGSWEHEWLKLLTQSKKVHILKPLYLPADVLPSETIIILIILKVFQFHQTLLHIFVPNTFLQAT